MIIPLPALVAVAGTNPAGSIALMCWLLGVAAIEVISRKQTIDVDEVQTPSPDTSIDQFEVDIPANVPLDPGRQSALDPLHGFKDNIVQRQQPVSETPTHRPPASALSLAFVFDIYLELKEPNWQVEIWTSESPRMSPRFIGNEPNTAQLMRELAPHIPAIENAAENSTIRKRLYDALDLIANDWQSPQRYSSRELSMAYRVLYGLCRLVITTSGDDTITRGISSPAKKAATLFQRIAQLPDGLTEEELVHCLEYCWKQYDET